MAHKKYKVIDGKKQCGQCGEMKTLDNYYYNNRGYYRSYCKACNMVNTHKFRNNPNNKEKIYEYGKKHYNKPGVKEQKFKDTQKYILGVKRKCVEYKGGKCIICGYNKCMSALEFHHKNPLEKDVKLKGGGINRRQSFESNKVELDKCVLLCCRCHREVHEGIILL